MTSATVHQPIRGRPTLRRVFALSGLLMLALMLPTIWRWIPQEISRWCLAGAEENELAGDFDRAEELIQRARRWDPESLQVSYFAANYFNNRARPWDSLSVLRRLHARHPATSSSLGIRATAYTLLEQHQLAIEDWATSIPKRIAEVPRDHPAFSSAVSNQHNNAAYAMAVAGRDLDTALLLVDQAIQLVGGEAAVVDPESVRQFADCAALVKKAKTSLFRRRSARAIAQAAIDRLVERADKILKASGPLLATMPERYRDYRDFVAGVHLYRSKFREQNGNSEKTALDREVIEEQLKLNVDDVRFPPLLSPGNAFQNLSLFLDTRGWVYYQQGQPQQALQDMKDALRMYAQPAAVFLREHPNFVEPDPRRHQDQLKKRNRNLAVMHYHRGKVYQQLGDEEAAGRDFQRVKQLGLEPNDKLHY